MLIHKIYIAYIITLCICFCCSLITFRLQYAFHLRLIAVLLGISVVTEALAALALGFFGWDTNFPIYNAFMLIQFVIYALYFKRVDGLGKVKRLIFPFLVVFFIFWLFTSFKIFKLGGWNSYASMLGDLFAVILCVSYFYTIFTSEILLDFKTSPEFWIAVGIFIYSCCELPITGIVNYIAHEFPVLAMTLYGVIQVLNMLMFLIFLYAFLCRLKINTTNY